MLGRRRLKAWQFFAILVVGALGISAGEDIAALRKRAEAGDAVAQYNLGVCYVDGNGVPQNMIEAVKWYLKAAEQGNANAQFNLGCCYCNGDGVLKDPTEAVKWWRKAAEAGDASAQFNLGVCYVDGNGMPKNMAEGVKWYRKAAEQGNADAQHNLGVCYTEGMGAPKDMVEAAKWSRKAAEQGNANDQYDLALCYDRGDRVPKDLHEAVKWYRKAAEQGFAPAQHNLGTHYFRGEGVPKDEIEALAWCNLAAASGIETSKNTRDIIERQLGRQLTLLAQQRSKELLAKIEGRKNRDATSRGETGSAEVAGDEPKATGSGVFITADGVILSAAHVVKGASQVRVVTSQGNKAAKILKVDAANDVVILKCEGTFVSSPIVPSVGVRLGQMVFTLGFPNVGFQGFEPKLTKGEISSMGGIQDDPRQWQISAPVQPGNSGGPLFDENGNVVGVVVAKLNALKTARISGDIPQNVNYAVKSAYVMPLLESLGSRLPSPHKPGASTKFEDVVHKARESVVLVVVY
jgi:TPR repeat protein